MFVCASVIIVPADAHACMLVLMLLVGTFSAACTLAAQYLTLHCTFRHTCCTCVCMARVFLWHVSAQPCTCAVSRILPAHVPRLGSLDVHSLYMCPTWVAWTCSARGTGVDALRMEALEVPSAKRSKTAGDAGEQQQTAGKK